MLDAIEEARQKLSKKLEVTREMVVEEYRRIAFADIRDVMYIEDGRVRVYDTATSRLSRQPH